MSMVVMCCGCRAVLGKDGDLVKHPGGLVPNLLAYFKDFKNGDKCAEFKNVDEANAAALKAGWQVRDKDGDNHRCPECLELAAREEEEMYAGRGALLEMRDGKILGVIP